MTAENNKDIKVTIICTTYNHADYISSALDSFLMQKTDFDYEILVHDDASTDGTSDIVKQYADKYPDMIVPIYETENKYSKGENIRDYYIHNIRGQYLAHCEGDDYWIDEYKLAKQVDFLESHPEYIACVHNTEVLDVSTGKKKEMYHSSKDHDVRFENVVVEGGAAYHTSSLICRTSYILDEYNDPPEFFYYSRKANDWPKAVNLSLKGKIRFLAECMSVYRLNTAESYSARMRKRNVNELSENYKSRNLFLDKVDEYTEHKYSDVIERVKRRNMYSSYDVIGDYKRAWEYRDVLSGPDRIKLWFHRTFPGLYFQYKKMKQHRIGKE